MKYQVRFSNAQQVEKFTQTLAATVNERRDFSPWAGIPASQLDQIASGAGGTLFFSTSKRENLLYQYQTSIYQQDRKYLYERDPTARMLCQGPAKLAWFKLPRTYNAAIDTWLDFLVSIGLVRAAIAAHTAALRDGGAFIYLNASPGSALGGPETRLTSGAKWFSFDYIPLDAIVEDSIIMDDGSDPLCVQHGVQSLTIRARSAVEPDNPLKERRITIHGSRLIAINPDQESRTWRGRSILDPIFDALWNLRDVEFHQKHGQEEGSPIVIEVDTEAGYSSSTDAESDLDAELRTKRSAATDSIGPVEGFKIKRIPAPDLDDPTHVIRLLASRISQGSGVYPVNYILASSRGSEQVTDQDRMDLASNIDILRQVTVHPLLAHLFILGQHCNMVARRLVFPSEVEWPQIRTLNPREQSFVDKSDATTLFTLAKAGKLPTPRIQAKFKDNPEGILPTQPSSDPIEIEEAVRAALEQIESEKDLEGS